MSASDRASLLRVLEENSQMEMKGCYTYLTLSQSEAEPERRRYSAGVCRGRTSSRRPLGRKVARVGRSDPCH